jgi:hypothetical protein
LTLAIRRSTGIANAFMEGRCEFFVGWFWRAEWLLVMTDLKIFSSIHPRNPSETQLQLPP